MGVGGKGKSGGDNLRENAVYFKKLEKTLNVLLAETLAQETT